MAIEAGTESEQTTDTSTEDVVDADAAETPQVEQEDTEDGEPPEPATESEDEAAPAAEAEKPQGLVVTLAEDVEEPPPPAGDKASKAWAELRKKAREAERERDELKAKLTAPQPAPTLPPEPDLADADVQFDKDLFKRKWAKWNEAKAEVDAHQAKAKTEQAEIDREWALSRDRYEKSRTEIKTKVPSYDAIEAQVARQFSQQQQAFLMGATDDTAKVVLALSQHPDKAKELAAIKSLPKFTRALVELEKSMTVKDSTKKPKAPPEKSIASAGSSPAASNLEALEKQAEKTGDYSKVFAEKRRLKQLQESRKK